MPKEKSRTILLTGDVNRRTREAGGTITPGNFASLDGSNEAVRTGADAVPQFVAVENSIGGDGIDDDYSEGDVVLLHVLTKGDEVNAILAAGQSVAVGALLRTGANGTVTSAGSGVMTLLALETVDASAGAERIAVMVL